ncbi:hypothetical protein [Streptomyces sp. NPDC088141]
MHHHEVRTAPADPNFRARLLELSITVSTHPFWDSVDVGDRVEARMAL